MEKTKDKIIIYRSLDKEIYNLLSKISTVEFGVIKFDHYPIKEINIKRGKPHKIVTVERDILLTQDAFKDSNYGD